MKSTTIAPPARFHGMSSWKVLGIFLFLGIFFQSLHGTELLDLTPEEVRDLPTNLWRLANDMFPPSPEPLPAVRDIMMETLQMVALGVLLGLLISLPMAALSARTITPYPVVNLVARTMIASARTVPDLVWALFLVVIVGLGPIAGVLTLMIDTIGFAGRFFAEAMDDVEPGPRDALDVIGATKIGNLWSVVFPMSLPSFINTVLFSLERAVQSSVLLGIVGAGGIGSVLMEPITWHDYDQAATVVICVFLLVYGFEQVSAQLRKRLLSEAPNLESPANDK